MVINTGVYWIYKMKAYTTPSFYISVHNSLKLKFKALPINMYSGISFTYIDLLSHTY
jgi:hypothetical protein